MAITKRSNYTFILLVILLLFIFMQSCNPAQSSSDSSIVEKGLTHELAILRHQQINNIQYNLFFDIPESKSKPVKGRVIIKCKYLGEADMQLDYKHNNITGKPQVNGKETELKWENEHIIVPSNSLLIGDNTIEISFTCDDKPLNRQPEFLYTLLVPDKASRLFPCFDQPDLKAEFKLELLVPETWMAASNEAIISKNTQEGKQLIAFGATPKISTYLFAFICGNFKTFKDEQTGITIYHREDSAAFELNSSEIIRLHKISLNWLEDYTAIDYPFNKFECVAIPDFQFGGMEHPGIIYYKSSSLFLPKTFSEEQRMSRASLIAHETSHMWFGDLVTMRWFDDVWLKEVFANLMASKIIGPLFPDVEHNLNFLLSHFPDAYEVDRSRGSHAIKQELQNLSNASSLYGAIIYKKAPIVMMQLENMLGDSVFRKGLQAYLTAFSFDNADWHELVQILEKVSNKNLKKWSTAWVEQPSMPHITSVFGEDSTKKQQQIIITQASDIWGNPLKPQQIRLHLLKKDKVYRLPVELSQQEVVVPFKDKEKIEAVLPNGDGKAYGYFELDLKSLQYFIKRINTTDKVYDRALLWINIWENFLNNKISESKMGELILNGLAEEYHPRLIGLITKYTQTYVAYFLPKANKSDYIEKLENVLWQKMKMPFDEKSIPTYYHLLAKTFRSTEMTENMLALWEGDLVIKDLTLNEEDKISLVLELAIRLPYYADSLIAEQQKVLSSTDKQRKLDFLSNVVTSNTARFNEFITNVTSGQALSNESWALHAAYLVHHPVKDEANKKYLITFLKALPYIQQNGDIFFPYRWSSAIIQGYYSNEANQIVRDFVANDLRNEERLKMKIMQASDYLYRASTH